MMKLSELLEHAGTAVIAGHVNPDGDCVGSCLALYGYIKETYPDVRVTVFLEEIPRVYSFVKGSEEAKASCDIEQCDIFFSLDSGDVKRIGVAGDLFSKSPVTVCIDHHISNTGYGTVNYIRPEASSTSELVYELIASDGGSISKETAEALYLGIIQDTGVFQYSCTGIRTMQIAGDLMSRGINFTKIIQETFFQKTYIQNLLLGRALTDSRLLLGGTCIVSVVSKEQIDSLNGDVSDLDGIVSQLRNTKGVETAVFLYEVSCNTYKVSMRSADFVDVSRIAVKYGGGGHRRAAGCTMTGESSVILSKILAEIEKEMAEAEHD